MKIRIVLEAEVADKLAAEGLAVAVGQFAQAVAEETKATVSSAGWQPRRDRIKKPKETV